VLISQDFATFSGESVLRHKYNGSPALLLSTVYPEYEWLVWKFSKCSNKFWEDDKNKRQFLDWVGKQLGIKEFSDWYKVSTKVRFVFSLFFESF
jgi:hypothetical protein